MTIKIAKSKLMERIDGRRTTIIVEMLEHIYDKLDDILNANLCVTSFCENSDLLSQWRGYAGGGGGVAIGFRSDLLTRLAMIEGGRLARCIYDLGLQADIIENLIDDLIANLEDNRALLVRRPRRGRGDFRREAEYFQRRLLDFGAFFKDAGFNEEREWRLVTGIKLYHDRGFEFRAGHSMLTPYFEIELCRDRQGQLHPEYWQDVMASITIGPCPYPGASMQAIVGLLIKHDLYDTSSPSKGFHVVHLKIPFRTW